MSSKSESENLRREGRLEAKIKVAIVRGRQTIELETSDVSFKGLFLRTPEPPPVRSLVRLRVKLPGREIEAHAMAVHVAAPAEGGSDRGAGVGVQFWGLAGPDRTAWDGFIQELLQAKRAAAKAAAASAAAEAPPESAEAGGTPSGIRIAPIVDLSSVTSRVG